MLRTIRSRLTAALISLAVIPLLVVGVFFSVMSYSALKQQALVEQQLQAQRVGTVLDSFVRELVDHMRLLAKVYDGFGTMTENEQKWLLDELLAFENSFQELRLLGPDGTELLGRHRGAIVLAKDLKNRADDPAFQHPFSSGQTYFGPMRLASDTGEPLMAIGVPLQSSRSGKTEGVFIGQARLKKIWELLASLIVRQGETVFIVDDTGAVVAHPNPSVVLRGTRFSLPANLKGFGVGLDNGKVVFGVERVELGDHFFDVVAQRSESKVLSLARNTLFLISLLILIALLTAASLSILAINNITRPLQHLASTARQIQEGDLSRRVEHGRHDEVGELAVAFNSMTDRLQQSLEEMAQKIEEKNQAEEKNESLEMQLRQAQKMEAIGTLAGGIAHDFNNILTIIFGFTELGMIGDEAEMTQEYLAEVHKAAERAKALVQQILTFSRKMEQQQQPLQMSLIVKEVLKMLRASIPTTIEIRQNISTETLVFADPTQIHQVIMNLCTNAYQAMKEDGGVLAVSLEEIEMGADTYEYADLPAGRYLKLDVGDTGYGIDPAIQEKIFEPYFTTKEVGEGTGLGLAVVHGIIQSHHGHITFYSELGKGTNFHVYLPVFSQEPGLTASPVTLSADAVGLGERILFVDDEEQICTMMHHILTKNGYQVTSFANAEDALSAFEEEPNQFDLVLTDMTMPHLTGIELANRLLAIRPELPVILCTGQSALIYREKALSMGIRDFLTKPIDKHTLLAAIKRTLIPQ